MNADYDRSPRGVIKVRHRLNATRAAMVRDELAALWPGFDIDVSFARQWWRPWRRGLGIKVIASAETAEGSSDE